MIKAFFIFVIIAVTQAVRVAELIARIPTGLIGSQVGAMMGQHVPNTSTDAPITPKPAQTAEELKKMKKMAQLTDDEIMRWLAGV